MKYITVTVTDTCDLFGVGIVFHLANNDYDRLKSRESSF